MKNVLAKTGDALKMAFAAGAIWSLAFIQAFADTATSTGDFGEINNFIGKITSFINNTAIPLIFAISLVVFIWGMFMFFIKDGAAEKEQGKQLAIWAVVAFVLMVSIWGIVNLIAGGLGFSGQGINNIPTVPTR